MKQNFDTSALRQTAAEIQGAVKPKSITPAMVGGLFSALVEAQGEVIEALAALEREVVTVKVNGYDGEQRVSAAGAKVYVDIFSIGGVPTVALPRQELTADANGIVTFEVFKGYRYAVFSKIDGLGASFQYVYLAGQDTRTIELYNMPIGVFMLGYVAYYNEDAEKYRCVPYISDGYVEDIWGDQLASWDAAQNEIIDDASYWGILVSSAETSFAIAQNSKSDKTLMWAGRSDYGHFIPTMQVIDPWVEDYDAMVELARADFDGNLNTAKILAASNTPIAAKFATDIEDWCYGQHFLPSAGQLYLMYLNKEAINALISEANDMGFEFAEIDTNWYWSSTQANEFCAWYVNMYYGGTGNYRKYFNYYVRAVSAFHFIY